MEQIFEKIDNWGLASKSWMQFWSRITPAFLHKEVK